MSVRDLSLLETLCALQAARVRPVGRPSGVKVRLVVIESQGADFEQLVKVMNIGFEHDECHSDVKDRPLPPSKQV